MSESPDANLQLKKRARRRLVGALALAGLAAIVLPMVMDDEPKQQVQDIQLRIPGQDQAPFVNRLETAEPAAASAPVKDAAQEAAPAEKEAPAVASKPAPTVTEKPADKAPPKVAEKPPLKAADKPADKTPEKTADKAPAKSSDKDDKKPASANKPANDEQRAAAIMNGKNVSAKNDEAMAATAGKGNGPCVILIGAFANPANVKVLQSKIGELGMKVITEPLDSPQGKKTRVRAGPFPSREAAQKALDKLKRIGVNGVIAARP